MAHYSVRSHQSLPELFKGIALFTPGGDLAYCIDPQKQNRWHLHLCTALQELLDLPEPPHFLVPCYTATIDRWRDRKTGAIRTAAEIYPLVSRYQVWLNLLFQTPGLVWRLPQRHNTPTTFPEDLCEPMVLSTYRQQFPQLWQDHDLVIQVGSGEPVLPPLPVLVPPASVPVLSPPRVNLFTSGYVLKLFVSGHSLATERTLQSLHQLLEQALHHPYTLSVVDILKHPEQAELNQIAATPTLVRTHPQPLRRIVGEMDNVEVILRVLET